MQQIRTAEGFESIVSVLGPFMEQTFKFNDCCEFAVVTGIMPLAKTGMLSGFNNASVRSILDAEGDEYFGFTEDEVNGLLAETGISSDKLSEIREWYDGYHFGNADVYNPYSVMMYLRNDCRTEAYWNNMTGGGMSAELLSNMNPETLLQLRDLRSGNDTRLISPIDTLITYTDVLSPTAKPSSVFSYLAMCGYLNAVRTGKIENGLPVCHIEMVNREVSIAFDSLSEKANMTESRALTAMDAVYRRDSALLKNSLESMLSGLALDRNWFQAENPTARHNRYRDIIMAYLLTPGLIAKEEIPKGYGYTDIIFDRTRDHPPVVMEIKTTVDDFVDLHSLAGEAMEQIASRKYAGEPGMEDAILVGIAIRMKTVEIQMAVHR